MPQYGHESGKQKPDGYSEVYLRHTVDDGNTTVAQLDADAVFTGTSRDLNGYASVLIAIWSDQDSAIDGLAVQFSHDSIFWHTTDEYTYFANTGPKTYSVQPNMKYFRIVYTNGSGGTTTEFHISTQLHSVPPKPSSHRLEDNLSGQDDAELSKAIIAARIPKGVYKNVNATAGGALQVHIGEENSDSFGTLRVSDPVALLDSTFAYNLNPRIFEDISTGNGSVTYDADGRFGKLAITAGSAGTAGLQSYQYTHYNPGKSHLIFMTACADPDGVGFVAGQKYETGYFDSLNGLFARRDDTGLHAVRRSSVTGSVVEESVDQADFTIDPLDGTGPSGVTLDFTKSQILVIDLQFLGVGRVRMGLEVAGTIVYAHEFNFANTFPGMYMQSGTLPVQWLLTDTGTTGFANAQAYCCMVSSEGGSEENRGIPFSGGSNVAITAALGADTHVLSIRPKLTFNSIENRIWNILEEVNMMYTGNNDAIVKIWYGATVTGGAWADVDTSDSGMEINKTAAHAPGAGILISSFFVPATNQANSSGNFGIKSRLPICLNKAGDAPIGTISMTVQGITASTPVWGCLNWREVR